MHRCHFLELAAAGAASAALPGQRAYAADGKTVLPFANGERELVQYAGKRPLIRVTARPPQLETPFEVFNEGVITPNDAFFVRYHLADLPLTIDPDTYRLEVNGAVEKPLQLSLRDLKTGFDTVELIAVNQCSGNSRGFFEPRVAGGQLANGAMGNARWRGVPLKAVLDKAGVKADAKEVAFDGLDNPVLASTPDFVKSLPIDHARDGEVMLAYAMNGKDLPFLNGYPLRLVVPGYYGTYWVKHLSKITVLEAPFEGFWMKTAYRIPDNECHCTEPGKPAGPSIPIGRYDVRSFITNLQSGQKVKSGKVAANGIAFDGESGIKSVGVSADGGRSWQEAKLGEDLGQYSFREWSLPLTFEAGQHEIQVRATSRSGETQPATPSWNGAGYMRNAIESIRVEVL